MSQEARSAAQDHPGGPEPAYAEHPGFGIWPCNNPWHTARRTEGLPLPEECPDCPNRWWAWDGTPCPEEYALLAEILSLREQVSRVASTLDRALLLLTPGTWGREQGLAVPSGDEWEVERIKLMRDTGRDQLADHLRDDRIDFLAASDQDTRAEVFRGL